MKFSVLHTVALACLLAAVSCNQEAAVSQVAAPAPSESDVGVIARVGSVTLTEADLAWHLKQNHSGRSDAASRQAALDELTDRARLTQAARDAGLDTDPVARAEIARILGTRLRETQLDPKLREIATAEIPEARLRAIYESQKDRFQSAEKRQIAVLWLNPGASPDRLKDYQTKLTQARDWYAANADLVRHPEQGFSTLSVDHSEHAASRYKNGVVGWLESSGGMEPWSRTVAEIAFSLEKSGDISAVITRPEGVFLVRCMHVKPAFLRPFEAVSRELAGSERSRLRATAEMEFLSAIEARYPADPTPPAATASR